MSAWASSPTDPPPVTVRRRAAALFASVLLGTGVSAPVLAQDTAVHASDAGVVVTRDVMVPMRDGVRLATDVYRPPSRPDSGAVAEQLATILIRTPYDKGFDPYALGPAWAAHGYAVVVQDTRGRYKSEGVWHWLTDDGPDGLDTVDWISHQPWSNGDVGMWGISYLGGTAHALAMAGDDAAPAGARIRRLAGASHGPWSERRLLGPKRHHRSRGPLQGHSGLP